MANKTDKLVVTNIERKLFVIPFYQRGYRWTGKNVKQLLSDLLQFANSDDSEYCLQPIVLQNISTDKYQDILREENSVIRVVDGQQRLTTIAIILKNLHIPTTWDIYYDTEKKRLSELLKEEDHSNSINDYFRREVDEAVNEWISLNSKEDERGKTLTDLFISASKRIAFLEYDIETSGKDTEKEGHKAFLRLNDGKTPLTSSELIRALYMVRSSGLSVHQQMEISKEWEIIENCLQNEQFWLMFNAKGLENTPTRIDLLFALVLRISLSETRANPRKVFEKLEDDNEHYDLEKVWDEVLNVFWWMQSCYTDIELCNYLSWIKAYTDNSATTIYKLWREHPVFTEFKDTIIKTIQDTKFGNSTLQSLENVDYNTWDTNELRKMFVLLNILDCNKSKERFRFDLFNKCKGWDIEHIDSQTPNDFKEDRIKKEWLVNAWNELTKEQKNLFINFHKKLVEDSDVCLESFDINTIDLNNFISYSEYLVEITQSTDDKIPHSKTHKIGNLALLNLNINRSYRNDIFPLKRKSIIRHINNGNEFIPPCTVKAFTKFYTKSASKITSWQNTDYDGYYEAMNSMFKSFMTKKVVLEEKTNTYEEDKLRKKQHAVICFRDISTSETIQNEGTKPRFLDAISFITFMDAYDVIIPKIQRLYVQGRSDKHGAKCLSGFAGSLVNSISTSSPLLLDFVYGIDTSNGDKPVFYPLDGQQRLTTLLLLSWICGLSKPNWNFKYESRRSTEFFIKRLLESDPPVLQKPDNYDELKNKAKERSKKRKDSKDYPSLCKEYISNNFPWFHESWLDDAGICGMIEMLDSLYDKLINLPTNTIPNMDNIVFLLNYLDVSKKSYDHIFLKMNSRGRELTEWDNINAVLDANLPESMKDMWPEKIQYWYELMWHKILLANKKDNAVGKDTDIIDKVDTKMVSVIELALGCAGYTDKYTNTYNLSKSLQSQGEEKKEHFYKSCAIIFSALEISDKEPLTYLIPNWTKSNHPRIPDFACKDDIANRFYQPLLVYYAMKWAGTENEKWTRVIWNLSENIGIEGSTFKQAVHLIEELSNGKDNILEYLSRKTIDDFSRYQKAESQLQEEIDKAKQIVENKENAQPQDWDDSILGEWKGWYNFIVLTESKRPFAGSIRFLFHDELYNVNWNKFCIKWIHADTYFDNEGIKEEYAPKMISALLKRCTKWWQIHDNFIFNKKDWKRNVLINRTYDEPLDFILESPTLDVEIADFEPNLICERAIRDRLSEEKLMTIITREYQNYRISGGRYFYYKYGKDGILFDWNSENPDTTIEEHRRNVQVQEIIATLKEKPDEFSIQNRHVSDDMYFGYTLLFKYRNISFEWGTNDIIKMKGANHEKRSLKVDPYMGANEILRGLQQLINEDTTI